MQALDSMRPRVSWLLEVYNAPGIFEKTLKKKEHEIGQSVEKKC